MQFYAAKLMFINMTRIPGLPTTFEPKLVAPSSLDCGDNVAFS